MIPLLNTAAPRRDAFDVSSRSFTTLCEALETMDIQPLAKAGGDDPAAWRKTALGLVLCAIYALAYAGFVVISLYDVALMDIKMPLGLNLGAFYGFALIALAFALGSVYTFACGAWERQPCDAADLSSDKPSTPHT